MNEVRRRRSSEEISTGRLEAFSDGVFAIAITLLILNVTVPKPGDLPAGWRLGDALLKAWPSYLAYAASFLAILIMWVNHHNIFRLIGRADHGLLIINGLLLMAVTFVPFPTSVVAQYIETPDQHVAAAFYAGTFVVLAIIFSLLWRYMFTRSDGGLLRRKSDQERLRSLQLRFGLGLPLYLAAFLVAFASATASLAICFALAVFYTLPIFGVIGGEAAASE